VVKALLKSSRSAIPADIERLWEGFLEDMLILYLPPHRGSDISDSEAVCSRALRNYIEDLSEYPSDILQTAWKSVRRSHRGLGWPLIAEIRDACKFAQQESRGPQQPKIDVFKRLQHKTDEINRLARSYTESFMRGELGRQAIEEGWSGDLRDFVWRRAHLQSQRIVRLGGGHIDVTIPAEEILEWKRRC
jgi:hypothetical protein